MSKEYDSTNRGSLFKNEAKESETHADYQGSINVEGTEYWLNAWIKTSKSGSKFMSLSVRAKQEAKPKAKPKSEPEIDTTDIPF